MSIPRTADDAAPRASTAAADAARVDLRDKLTELHTARVTVQRAEANMLRARATWLDMTVEHCAATHRLEQAVQDAQRASESLTRAQLCTMHGGGVS